MRIRKILYFGSTKIFFILTYPLNPLLKKGDFVTAFRVGSIKVVGDSERRNSIRGGFAKFCILALPKYFSYLHIP